MDFKARVISVLSPNEDFISLASIFFNESIPRIEQAIGSITNTTITALKFQCFENKKTDEIYRISKECALLRFDSLFGSDLRIAEKGRGINSEIFGLNLVYTVDDIAYKTRAKSRTINFLLRTLTPAILSALHQEGIEKRLSRNTLCGHIQKMGVDVVSC